MKNLNYLMDHILYQIFRVIFSISAKKHETVADNPPTKICLNKVKNRVTVTINTRYYTKLLMPKMKKLLRSTENKLTKDENGENVHHLEITEVALVHCNIVKRYYQTIQESCIHLFPINRLVNY